MKRECVCVCVCPVFSFLHGTQKPFRTIALFLSLSLLTQRSSSVFAAIVINRMNYECVSVAVGKRKRERKREREERREER